MHVIQIQNKIRSTKFLREKHIEIDIQELLNEYFSIDKGGNRHIHFKNFKLDSNEGQVGKKIESKIKKEISQLKRKNTKIK